MVLSYIPAIRGARKAVAETFDTLKQALEVRRALAALRGEIVPQRRR